MTEKRNGGYIIYKDKFTGNYYQNINPHIKFRCWHSGKEYVTLQNCDNPNDNIIIKLDNLINFELIKQEEEVMFDVIH